MPYNINIDIYSETLTKVDGKFINKFPQSWMDPVMFSLYNPTANTKIYDVVKKGTKTYTYNVYVCPECSKLLLKNPKEFINFMRNCNSHIRSKYYY